MTETKTVLVIGGSFGGLATIHGLRNKHHNKDCNIILVEPKNCVEVAWGSYRFLFDEKMAEQGILPLESFCQKNKVQHIRSTVTKCTSQSATLANGETIAFDVVVVAVGAATKWTALGKGRATETSREARLAKLKVEGKKLLQTSVLVV